MIETLPTLAENISDISVTVPGAIYTSWGYVYQLIAVVVVIGVFIGLGLEYQFGIMAWFRAWLDDGDD